MLYRIMLCHSIFLDFYSIFYQPQNFIWVKAYSSIFSELRAGSFVKYVNC